ncbi:hypothetical protein LAUMK7_02446 [Mycobacterium kansasii]|nr:hypothetical protein LAUMK40_02464 [Mycobacterium kansasii]VAZ74545.1 hypothetical protein LAUMK7_02446 [Mycobacterium kansasii]
MSAVAAHAAGTAVAAVCAQCHARGTAVSAGAALCDTIARGLTQAAHPAGTTVTTAGTAGVATAPGPAGGIDRTGDRAVVRDRGVPTGPTRATVPAGTGGAAITAAAGGHVDDACDRAGIGVRHRCGAAGTAGAAGLAGAAGVAGTAVHAVENDVSTNGAGIRERSR